MSVRQKRSCTSPYCLICTNHFFINMLSYFLITSALKKETFATYIWHTCPTVVKYHCSKLCHITYSIYHHSYNNFTFFGFNPCLKTCSRTIKKCCKGILSESSIRPYFSDVSISSLTISFDMLTKLLLSIIAGSRAEIKENYF